MAERPSEFLNVNVGVMGHVDSGKTSLVEKLSTVLSTAALDKHPQSQERGITLDLGFSALQVELPERLKDENGRSGLQFTLVDCPGHASLIRTVLGGAHIMDMMILVVDVTKGIQVQTAECLVVGEISVDKILVLLNKIDLVDEGKRQKIVSAAGKRVMQTLRLTSFKTAKLLPVSAKTVGLGLGMERIVETLTGMVDSVPERQQGPLLFAIDHCFRIKGQGTVLTGTVLQGTARVHDVIEFPALKETRKIKSIQMFRQAVTSVAAGDRAGICVKNLDTTRIERGLGATPGSVPTFKIAIASVEKVRFYAARVASGQKLHVMLGHAVAVATCTFFKAPTRGAGFAMSGEYVYLEELQLSSSFLQWALIRFEAPMTAPMDLSVVGARLDSAPDVQSCRLCLHGKVLHPVQPSDLERIKVYKLKRREGVIKEVTENGMLAVCGGMFKKETDFRFFADLPVVAESGHRGKLLQRHGADGDFLVKFQQSLSTKSDVGKGITLLLKKYISM